MRGVSAFLTLQGVSTPPPDCLQGVSTPPVPIYVYIFQIDQSLEFDIQNFAKVVEVFSNFVGPEPLAPTLVFIDNTSHTWTDTVEQGPLGWAKK